MADAAGARHSTGSGVDGARRARRRMVAWDPGPDTLIAGVTLLGFWGCYWAGTTVHDAFLYGGVLVLGTLVPAVVVLHQRGEGLAGLGITRRLLVLSLIISLVLGVGSAFQLVTVAAEAGIPLLPHLLGNLLVLWEPLFVFGWLFLRWERAFGWLPAIALVAGGFALQHVGSVPPAAALSFGAFAGAFAIVFALVRNLVVLWPLFYPVASGIGTLQAGFQMDWGAVGAGAVLLVAQLVILLVAWRLWRRAPERTTDRSS